MAHVRHTSLLVASSKPSRPSRARRASRARRTKKTERIRRRGRQRRAPIHLICPRANKAGTLRFNNRFSKSSFLHCMDVRWQKLTSLVESSMRRPSASSSLTLFFPEYLHTMHTRHASRRLLRHLPGAGTTNAARTADVDSIAHKEKNVSLSRCGC